MIPRNFLIVLLRHKNFYWKKDKQYKKLEEYWGENYNQFREWSDENKINEALAYERNKHVTLLELKAIKDANNAMFQ